MLVHDIRKELFAHQDVKYRDFQSKLIPTLDPDAMIGVRTPVLRQFAKRLSKLGNIREFLDDLPHCFFDENQLHAFIISDIKEYTLCMEKVNLFLPFVDNWATCDQMSPKVFQKHRSELLGTIQEWLKSDHTYTMRFGIKMLMEHFLEEDFCPDFLELVSAVRSDEYYVNMMIAWFFATALAKQYVATLPFLEHHRLDKWTHHKTIQKALESYRITADQKEYLKTLK